MNAPSRPALRSYDRVASVYDLLALVWSGGGIASAGAAVATRVRPGQTVLIAGVGGGRDAAALARAGARLTLVDLSPAMLARAERRVRATVPHAELELVCGDALSMERPFDIVCAHYFLNVFGPDEVEGVVFRLARCLHPGGLLSIADFSPRPRGLLAWLHYVIPMKFFAALGLCVPHPVYSYEELLPDNLVLEATEMVRIFKFGPTWHQAWFVRDQKAGPICLDRADRVRDDRHSGGKQ